MDGLTLTLPLTLPLPLTRTLTLTLTLTLTRWGPQSTLLVDDDPIKCERNPPHTAIHPAKWRALHPPDGSQLELAPQGALATYLEALHAAPDTQAEIDR